MLPLSPQTKCLLLVAGVLLAGCTRSSQTTPGGGTPGTSNDDPLTGVWEGSFDAGSRLAKLRFTLVEDAGALSGFEAMNDPDQPDYFHTLDLVSGVRRGNDVSLQASTASITASLDGGHLIGAAKLTEPSKGLDAGDQPASVTINLEMIRTTTTVVLPDAGELPPP